MKNETKRNSEQLDTIGINELENIFEDLTEEQKKIYTQKCFEAYDIVEKVLRQTIKEQIEFFARNAKDENEMYFMRGGINVAEVILDFFKEQKGKVEQERQEAIEQQSMDKHAIIN